MHSKLTNRITEALAEALIASALEELLEDPPAIPATDISLGVAAFASPVLRDLQGNGTRDILIGTFDGNVHRFDSTGSAVSGWPQMTSPGLNTSPGVGDLDGDGVAADIAIGSSRDDDGGNDRGAVWIVFAHWNGTVRGH